MKFASSVILIFIYFLFPVKSYSQGFYVQGYVVTNNNDTLYGYVKDRDPVPYGSIYNKVRFKDNPKAFFAKKYSPDDIFAYKCGEFIYESLWYKIETNFIFEEYKSIPGFGEKKFFKVILKDYLSYYQLEYNDSESNYVDAIDLFKRQDDNYFVKVTQGIFGLKKNKLMAYFRDCPELAGKIQSKQITNPLDVAIYYNTWKQQNQ